MAPAKAPATPEKKGCHIGRTEFEKNAKPVEVIINGVPMVAVVKEFSSGSFGWYATGKVPVKVGDTTTQVQVGLNMTVVGSKDAK